MRVQSYFGGLCESKYPEHATFGSWCKSADVRELELRLKDIVTAVRDFLPTQEDNLSGNFDQAKNYTHYIRLKYALDFYEKPI